MPWLALIFFVGMPILEIYVIIQVGQWIGAIPTVLLLVFESLLGAWIVRREGTRAWRALRSALQGFQMPGRELADGALILIGGTLLLAPGFVTDVFGFFLVLPFTRPLARTAVMAWFARRAAKRVRRQGRGTDPYAPQDGDVYRIYRADDDQG